MKQENNLDSKDELYHWGRKGMKWGQHIFGKDKGPSTPKSKSVKDMTDDELSARNKRVNLAIIAVA